MSRITIILEVDDASALDEELFHLIDQNGLGIAVCDLCGAPDGAEPNFHKVPLFRRVQEAIRSALDKEGSAVAKKEPFPTQTLGQLTYFLKCLDEGREPYVRVKAGELLVLRGGRSSWPRVQEVVDWCQAHGKVVEESDEGRMILLIRW